jgi:hypothetical protein
MKTKNLLLFFCPLFVMFFYISTKAENILKPQIDKEFNNFLDNQANLPSKFSVLSIKSFFSDFSNNFSNIDNFKETRTPNSLKNSANKSKTLIFNQSLTCFTKEVYNNRDFPKLISQDGTPFVDFIELCSELNLDLTSLYTCIRLFYNKTKECIFIDDTVIIQILKPLACMLEKYFEIEEPQLPTQNFFSKKFEKVLIAKFTDHLPEFQTNQNLFLEQLSQDLSSVVKKELDFYENRKRKNISVERFRQIILNFLELSLSKCVWEITAYEGIWNSVISIANNLQLLADHGIIDHEDDLDNLLWSLIHSFCSFLDLEGSSLPLVFYEHIESDLNNKVVAFLEAEEQDDEIKTKKTFVTEALIKAKAKAFAFEKKGIITDQLL